jgi:acyl phosphate:glycerol-3-phosphate acyltransferase
MMFSSPLLFPITAVLISALAGSVPTAWIAVRIVKKSDIRQLGSGNVGATNAVRVLGFRMGLPVLLFDFLKGFLPVFLILRYLPTQPFSPLYVAIASGIASLLGHVFCPWLGFRGGKGVATGAGVFTALFPLLFPICLAVFLVVLKVGRRVSAASIMSAICVAPSFFLIHVAQGVNPNPVLSVIVVLIPLAVVITHRKNIKNLLRGTEPRLF